MIQQKKRFPKNKKKDRFENLDNEFFYDVYNGYLELAKSNKKRIKVVDSNQSKEEVCNEIKKIITKTFNNFNIQSKLNLYFFLKLLLIKLFQ